MRRREQLKSLAGEFCRFFMELQVQFHSNNEPTTLHPLFQKWEGKKWGFQKAALLTSLVLCKGNINQPSQWSFIQTRQPQSPPQKALQVPRATHIDNRPDHTNKETIWFPAVHIWLRYICSSSSERHPAFTDVGPSNWKDPSNQLKSWFNFKKNKKPEKIHRGAQLIDRVFVKHLREQWFSLQAI